jgi:hypothetical protein
MRVATKPDGADAVMVQYHRMYDGEWPAVMTDPYLFARETARESAGIIADADLIWCDPPMVALLAAASDTYPATPIEPRHLVSPSGIVIFSEPVPAVWDDPTGTQAIHRLSAITWASLVASDGQLAVSVVGWIRAWRQATYRPLNLRVRCRELQIHTSAYGHFGAPTSDAGGPASPSRMLQTLTALLRSPLVSVENTERAASSGSPRRPPAPSTIRRVYLRRPEHGASELQAARDARAGRRHRGHWVSGHWKNQWYPSVEEHRERWIEGYPRGDFDLGDVPGTKVRVATDRPARQTSQPNPS